jgi:hypothetical protein
VKYRGSEEELETFATANGDLDPLRICGPDSCRRGQPVLLAVARDSRHEFVKTVDLSSK